MQPTGYYPTVFFNEFWLLRDKLIALNETVEKLEVNFEFGPISLTRWQLYLQIDQSFQIHKSYGSMMDGEADELKVLYLMLVCVRTQLDISIDFVQSNSVNVVSRNSSG